jgi:RHS repeat-associated protein
LIYTPQGRLLKHLHKINHKPWELLSYNSYDYLGGLISKKVGGTDISTFTGLQKVDYRYNVRGWLTDINNKRDLADEIDDLFAFHINYNAADSDDYTPDALYNGNICETYWRTVSDNVVRSYGYEYDALNRLRNAVYQKPGSTPCVGNYDEYLEYDKNGNIQLLRRTGNSDTDITTVLIDDLTYHYSASSPNRLLKVTDATNAPEGFADDSDGTNDTSDDYEYDDFGNLTSDQNKQIGSIFYNHLNLPVKVIIGGNDKIAYIYDAVGKKLRKIVTESATVTNIEYLSGFQYKNDKLQFFPTTEGYVSFLDSPEIDPNAAFNYVYNYTDHLGNIRLSYSLDPSENVLKILEENHYYPFGLKHENYSSDVKHYAKEEMQPLGIKPVPPLADAEYQYKFNGKEWQDELGLNVYDYGARNYDPAIGRWMNIDPLAENSRRWTPYNYAYNNPIYFVDPDGMQAVDNDDLILKGEKPAIDKTIETMNSGLGGDYASVDKNGKVSLNASEDQISNMTTEQKGLYDVINQTMDPSETTEISMLDGDNGVVVGDYKNGKIDIGDVNAHGTSVPQETKYSVLGHEVNEQYEYQQGNTKEYSQPGSSHMNSSAKESTMNGGWERGKSSSSFGTPTKNVIPGAPGQGTKTVYGANGTFNISFSKNGKAVISTTKVVNGNVVPRK